MSPAATSASRSSAPPACISASYHDVDDVVISDEQVGYVMPFVVPGTWGGFQSHMAATLNIDWLVDLAAQFMRDGGMSDVDSPQRDPPPPG